MVYDLAHKGAHLPLAARGIVIATVILTEVVIFDGYRQLRENTNEVRRSQVTIPATEGVLRSILTRQKGGQRPGTVHRQIAGRKMQRTIDCVYEPGRTTTVYFEPPLHGIVTAAARLDHSHAT